MAAATRRERWLVAGICALAVAIRLGYVLLTAGHTLAGDEVEYDTEGRLAAAGQWLHTTCCSGVPHVSLQKMPLYPAWVSAIYTVLGPDPDRVLVLQTLLAPVTVALVWLLGRRLFGPAVALAAAAVVAVEPGTWQFESRLYSEALATPLTLAALLVALGRPRPPAAGRAALAGALVGAGVLVRPTAAFVLAAVAVAWWSACGARRGTALLAVSAGTAALVVAPWTVRNAIVEPDHFVPLSVQAAAAYGTFNDDAAHDGNAPYGWRPVPSRDRDLFGPGASLSDGELYAAFSARARAYVADHPDAVPKAFFWNGITRVWDLRRPRHTLAQVRYEGLTRPVAIVAMVAWWVVLPLALVALASAWRRGRRELVLAVAAAALALSLLATSDGRTRYRAPLEPLFVLLACSAVVTGRRASSRRDRFRLAAVGGGEDVD